MNQLMSPCIWVLECILKINHSSKYWEEALRRFLSVMTNHNDILTFSRSHTSIWEKRYLWQRFARACWEPAFWAVSLLRPLAIVIHGDYKEKDDKVYFKNSICHWDLYTGCSLCSKSLWHSSAPPCFLIRGKVSYTEKAEQKQRTKAGEVPHLFSCSQIQGGKCLGDTFQKVKPAPWLGQRRHASALASAGICLYIWITPSFSFISSRTWLPNEHIDYLSWMHISQLKAIKSYKISTESRSTSGSNVPLREITFVTSYWTSAASLAPSICQLIEMSQPPSKLISLFYHLFKWQTRLRKTRRPKAMQLEAGAWVLNPHFLFTLPRVDSTHRQSATLNWNGVHYHTVWFKASARSSTNSETLRKLHHVLCFHPWLCKIMELIAHRILLDFHGSYLYSI